MNNGNDNSSQHFNIELPQEQAEGIYVNLAILSHTTAEFFIDFTRVVPGVPQAKVYSRIIMTPQHIKSLLLTLQENISLYEDQFGEIKIHPSPPEDDSDIFPSPNGDQEY